MIDTILKVFFPPRCMGCKTPGEPLCGRCIKLARRTLTPLSPTITSTFSYKDPLIKRSIHAIKYYKRRDLIPALAQEVAKDIRLPSELSPYVLIPVPMPRLRKLLRGYNQAELLAKELGDILAVPVDTTILIRKRSPSRQVKTTSKQERLTNQRDSFTCTKNLVSTHVILIDDVATTGATLESAVIVLKKNGAKSVQSYVIAH